MGLSFKIISMSSSISVPNFMLLPQNPQFCHHFTPFCWTISVLPDLSLICPEIDAISCIYLQFVGLFLRLIGFSDFLICVDLQIFEKIFADFCRFLVYEDFWSDAALGNLTLDREVKAPKIVQ